MHCQAAGRWPARLGSTATRCSRPMRNWPPRAGWSGAGQPVLSSPRTCPASRSRPAKAATAAAVGFALAPPVEHDTIPRHPSGVFVLTRGTPDPRLLPTIELARAYRRVLQRDGRRLLVYGDHRGHPGLRLELAEMLASARGLTVTADDLLVTRGSQSALDLIARALVTPGDVVAVEALGHPVVRAAFRLAGARLRPVPVDRHGACVGDLERLAGNHRIRAPAGVRGQPPPGCLRRPVVGGAATGRPDDARDQDSCG
ncbi:aminotransferase class I/II-fold pyridoxal phosphate-dependent enzyme [Micromonospora sp. DT47]|uniref:aminotransferase class I/II-fold pyridoxal phosphate-dependent enzyme n=1 Tax=Micromonospora sp. DT47 TaxID=3393431 RepID=UPI003CF9BBCE